MAVAGLDLKETVLRVTVLQEIVQMDHARKAIGLAVKAKVSVLNDLRLKNNSWSTGTAQRLFPVESQSPPREKWPFLTRSFLFRAIYCWAE